MKQLLVILYNFGLFMMVTFCAGEPLKGCPLKITHLLLKNHPLNRLFLKMSKKLKEIGQGPGEVTLGVCAPAVHRSPLLSGAVQTIEEELRSCPERNHFYKTH